MEDQRKIWDKRISYRDRYNLKPKQEPTIDKEVSQIVGKKVHTNDPRLIKVVLEFKNKKDPNNYDNFLLNPEFRKRLKEIFNS